MDFTSALKPDVFRSFAIYICPGVVAVAPWLYGVIWPDGIWRLLYGSGTLVSAAILVFCGLTVGLVLEELGGMTEVHIDEKLLKKSDTEKVLQSFYRYLVTPSAGSIVADKFLSATVTRYKFELSMCPAALLAALGLLVAFFYRETRVEFIIGAVLLLALSAYLYTEACDSAELLHRIREKINEFDDAERIRGKR